MLFFSLALCLFFGGALGLFFRLLAFLFCLARGLLLGLLALFFGLLCAFDGGILSLLEFLLLVGKLLDKLFVFDLSCANVAFDLCEFLFRVGDFALLPFDVRNAFGAAGVGSGKGGGILRGQAHDAAGHLGHIEVLALFGRNHNRHVLLVNHPLPRKKMIVRLDVGRIKVGIVQDDRHSLPVGKLEDHGDILRAVALKGLSNIHAHVVGAVIFAHLEIGVCTVHDAAHDIHLTLKHAILNVKGVIHLGGVEFKIINAHGVHEQIVGVIRAKVIDHVRDACANRLRRGIPVNLVHSHYPLTTRWPRQFAFERLRFERGARHPWS